MQARQTSRVATGLASAAEQCPVCAASCGRLKPHAAGCSVMPDHLYKKTPSSGGRRLVSRINMQLRPAEPVLWPTASCSTLTRMMLHVHKPTALNMASLHFTPKLTDTPEGCRTRKSRRRVRVLGATWQQQLRFSMARRQVPFRAQSFNAAFLHLLCPPPLAKKIQNKQGRKR